MKFIIALCSLMLLGCCVVPRLFVPDRRKIDTPLVMLLFGPPGSGKGTQAVSLSSNWGIPHISTGDLLRNQQKTGSLLGEQIAGYLRQGSLVPDDVIFTILEQRLAKPDCQKGYILDGFPRTVSQAQYLDSYWSKQKIKPFVFSLQVPDAVLIKRILSRRVCEGCQQADSLSSHSISGNDEESCKRCGGKWVRRQDDTEEVMRERLAVFHQETQPVESFYAKKGLLREIDGSLASEQIESKIQEILVNSKK